MLQQNGELEVQKYECRLRKSKKGGKPPPGPAGGVKKCYGKTVRVPGLCDVRIKIVRTVSAPITITIQRLDEHEHSHTLERSREIAPSTLALQLAATEAAKGYAPAQVLNALRGIGTPEGSTRLIEVGGAHLTRYGLRIPMICQLIYQLDSIRVRSVLQLRELEERLRQQLYSIHEIIDETNIETTEHGAIVENWMNLVTSTVEPLTDVLPEEIVRKGGRPWEL